MVAEAADGLSFTRVGVAADADAESGIFQGDDTEFWTAIRENLASDAQIDMVGAASNEASYAENLADFLSVSVDTDSSDDCIYFSEAFNADSSNGVTLADTPNRELVIINSSVLDADTITDKLPDSTDVLYLENGSDALDAINSYLDSHSDVKYDAIHIVSHGNEGYFVLNGTVIDDAYVSSHEDAFASIGEHVTDDGDIMLYGCNLADSEAGQRLVDHIADVTQADVAASIDSTGIGGNWELEYQAGLVETSALDGTDYLYNLTNRTVTVSDDSGAGSLRQAIIDAASGDEITFSGVTEVTLSSVITITDKNLTIDGFINDTANVTIQVENVGSSNYRMFVINGDSDVTFENINLKGGKYSAADNGGGMYIDGASVTLTNVVFSDTATGKAGSNGGAIYVTNTGSLNISDSQFLNNGTLGGGGQRFGGAIYVNSGSLSVTDTLFSGNKSESADNLGFGGAVGINAGSAIFKNVTFTGNSTRLSGNSDGGALWVGGSAEVTVSGSTFATNESMRGGAIYVSGNGKLTVSDTIFNANTAKDGGAIFTTRSPKAFSLTDVTFTNNTATGKGGAIFAEVSDGNSALIDNALFSGNTAADGGALYLGIGGITVNNSTFHGNSATGAGGAIYRGTSGYDNGFSMANTTVAGNTAGTFGAGIYFAATTPANVSTNILNSVIVGNTVSGAADDFYVDATYASNITLAYNIIGAYELNGKEAKICLLTEDKIGKNNVLLSTLANAPADDTNIFNATADDVFGGTPVLNGRTVALASTYTAANHSIHTGLYLNGTNYRPAYSLDGSAWGYADNARVYTISNAALVTATTVDAAGYFRAQVGNDVNTAGSYQINGAKVMLDSSGTYSYFDTVSAANNAAASGDTIYVYNGMVTENTTVSITKNITISGIGGNSGIQVAKTWVEFGNNASNYRLMVASGSGFTFVVENLILMGGRTSASGTIWNLEGNAANMNPVSTTFRNVVFDGGSNTGNNIIYSYYFGTGAFDNSLVIENSVFRNMAGNNGLIRHNGSNLTISDTVFENNNNDTTVAIIRADGNSAGNSVYNFNNVTVEGYNKNFMTVLGVISEINITNSTFSNITTRVFNFSNANACNTLTVNVEGSTFINNGSTTETGGVFYYSSFTNQLNIKDSTFIGNKSSNGGVVFLSNNQTAVNSSVNIENSTFEQNTATDRGGAIYYNVKGDLNIANSTFEGNTAANRGGAVYYVFAS